MGKIEVSPEILAKLKAFGSDGKIGEEEKRALEKAGASAELLEAIATKDIKVEGDNVVFTTKEKPVAQQKPKEDNLAWYEKTWNAVKGPVIGMAAGAAVGAGAGFLAGGIGALPGAVVGALGGLFMTSMTSCTTDEPEPPKSTWIDNSKYESTVTINFTVNPNSSNEEIIKAINDLKQTIADYAAKQEEYNKAILKQLVDQGVSLDRIVEMLGELGISMSTVIELIEGLTNIATDTKDKLGDILYQVKEGNNIGAENNKVLNAILAQLKTINGNDADIKALLNAIIAKIDKNNDMTAKQSAILVAIMNKLNSMDKNISNKLLAIIDKIDSMGQNNYDMLVKILNAIETGKTENNALLEAILNKVIEGNDQNKDMDTKTHDLLAKLLEAIANNTSAINKNTEVAKATYDLVAKLLAKMDELKNDTNVNFSAILDAIANISTGGNVDLSTIEQLLRDLLKSSEMNNQVLTSIEAKLEAVSVTIGGIKLVLGEGHEKILAKLDEILKKIPNGCHCDVTVIIQKLDELIESIKKNPDDDNKHEGILDDLEDLFN